MAVKPPAGARVHGTGADLRLLLASSTVAFAIALPLMITLHERGHALAGVGLGLGPIVYPNQVVFEVQGTTSQQVIVALAGPVASLLIGVVVLLIVPAVRGFWTLFLLWFGALNVQEFTGYLMTAPFQPIRAAASRRASCREARTTFWRCWHSSRPSPP